jgi:DNA-binding PadR family transcriptional regulator
MARDRKCSRQTLALLAALIEAPRSWRHGYDLSSATGLKSGTLYPILMRLSERKMLDSKWQPPEQPGRPARHMYRLTGNGAAYAQEQVTAYASQPRLATAHRGRA